MNFYENILNDVKAKAEAANPRTEKDFVKDGILYCGVCGEPKETKDPVPVIGRRMPVTCLCKKAEEQRKEERIKQQNHDTLRCECFDSPKQRRMTFDADDRRNGEMSKICRNYAERFGAMNRKGLVLYGGVGTGKTFLGCCIANALIDRGIACRYTSFAAQASEREDLTQYGFVVLDDFGAERDTSYMGEVVYNTIDTLYRFDIPFLLTTNMSSEELKKASDTHMQRILSRLYECCTFHKVDGQDRRREALIRDTQRINKILTE